MGKYIAIFNWYVSELPLRPDIESSKQPKTAWRALFGNKILGKLVLYRLLLAKIYNFWQVCSFVGLLLAKIYNFGKYVRLSVCLFVCPFCQA